MSAALLTVAKRAAIIAAKINLDQLTEAGAPKDVLTAAKTLVQHAESGTSPGGWIGDVLRKYAASQQRVDRYGK